MAIPSSGKIGLGSEIKTEFGGSAPYSISQYYRGGGRVPNGPSANANIATSGTINFGSFRGAINELVLTIAATTTNYNVYNAFVAAYGTPSGAVPVRLTINAGVTVGATAGNTALTIGQFPSGSTIIIDNNGSIQGYGGAAGTSTTGGAGGDAINANYANQTVTINNKTGATIYGGGGGGGRGGNGGTGGQGYYVYVSTTGSAQICGDCNTACANAYGGGYYCYSGCARVIGCQYRCTTCGINRTAYTSGGAGGAGGTGGVGQGYNQTATAGATGTGGGAPGTNGGWGGTGGSGGSGGGWGAAGSTGNTGATGGNGNYTSGAAGSGGYAGGAAGRYLVKGSNSVTINNSGTVAGGLA